MSGRSLSQVREFAENPSIRIFSIDVFDTLLLRDTIPEPLRFKQISDLQIRALHELANIEVSATDLYLLRLEAARTVYFTKRPNKGGREATWREIFDLIFTNLNIPKDSVLLNRCMQEEIAYEEKRLAPNWNLINLLEQARANGKQIVCLSDMYLDSSRIAHLVDKVVGRDLGYDVYSSADFGFGKGCGALFHQLKEDYSVEFNEVFHCGDNWHADYVVPQSLEIHAHYLPRPFLWRLTRKYRHYRFGRSMPAP